MAGAEAKLDFTADDKVAKSVLDRQTKQIAQLEEQVKKLNETSTKGFHASKKAADEWAAGMGKLSEQGRAALVHSDASWKSGMANLKAQREELNKHSESHQQITHWLSHQGKELLAMGAGYLTVEKGVEAVVGTYEKWKEKIKELGTANAKLTADMVKALALGGMLPQGPEVQEWIEKGGGGTPQQRLAAVSGVRAGAPNASAEDLRRMAEQVVKSAPTGVDLHERGTLVGRLGAVTPSMSADDLGDLAAKMTALAGHRASELTSPAFLKSIRSLVASGMDPDEAYAMGLSALQNDQRMRGFSKIGEVLEEPAEMFKPKGGRHRLTPEERAKQQFGAMNQTQRLAALRGNRVLAHEILGEQGASFQLTPDTQVQDLTGQLRTARTEDFQTQQLGQLKGFGAGQAAIQEQTTAEAEAELEKKLGPLAAFRGRLGRRLSSGAYQKGWAPGFAESTAQFFGGIGQPSQKEGMTSFDIERGRRQGTIPDEEAAELQRTLKELVAAVKENTRVAPRARVDVDAHSDSYGVSGSW